MLDRTQMKAQPDAELEAGKQDWVVIEKRKKRRNSVSSSKMEAEATAAQMGVDYGRYMLQTRF